MFVRAPSAWQVGFVKSMTCAACLKLGRPEAAKDTGHIQRTDEYPFPPPEGGYIWVKSISFATLERAVVQLEADIQRAKDCLGNAELINNAETRLDKERTHLELLHTKDDNDKVAGVAEAEKAATEAVARNSGRESNSEVSRAPASSSWASPPRSQELVQRDPSQECGQ